MIRIKSIKTRLSIAVSLLIIVMIGIVSYVTLTKFEASTRKLIEQQQFSTVSLLSNEIDDRLSSALEQLTSLSHKFPSEIAKNAKKASAFLDNHDEIRSVFNNGIFLFSNSGIMIAETQKPSRIGQDFSYREYLKSTMESHKPYIGNPYFSSQAHKHPAVMLTAPIMNTQGQIVGILAGSIDLITDNILGRLIDIKNGNSGFFYLITKDLNLILHPDKSRILNRDIPEGSNKSLGNAVNGFEGTVDTVTSKGIPALSAYKSLKSKDWIVGSVYPIKDAFAPFYQARTTLIFTLIFITILVTVIIWSLMNVLTRPLLAFTKHVESIATKTGDERLITVESSDEITRLTIAFNQMVKDLDKKQAELVSNKEHLSVTLRSIADGVIVTDINNNLLLMNRAAETLTGWAQEEVLGSPLNSFFAIYDEKTRKPITNTADTLLLKEIATSKPAYFILVSRENTEYLAAGNHAPIKSAKNKVIGAVLVFQDITEKRKLQDNMIRADKLESIGVLAGGIAHDFNNLLTSILGNISLAKLMSAGCSEKLLERLSSAEFASLRARDLTKRLLTFSHGGVPVKKVFSFSELLRNYSALALSGSNAVYDLKIQEGLWPVNADFGQMGQVISNLLINACQSMPNGGRISVRCINLQLSDDSSIPLAAGKYLQLEIADEGIGICEEHLNRIFEPYFTQKENGSGLGLATVYFVIQNHYGHIEVNSELGIGTTFTIYIPALEDAFTNALLEKSDRLHGSGHILIMDDEESIRDIAGEMLIHCGFTVDYSRDGAETIVMFETAIQKNQPYDLILMDLTIPNGLGGKETNLILKEKYPEMKTIVSSGYSNDPILSEFKNFGFTGFVLKPYKVEELCSTVIDILKQPSEDIS